MLVTAVHQHLFFVSYAVRYEQRKDRAESCNRALDTANLARFPELTV